mmetsp:Transcript_5205/g.13209  ORF Transcript_5205/g.13209 Transcript_5205/m.13209 type:complete len:88 (-) Transcript_5205:52-315(-)
MPFQESTNEKKKKCHMQSSVNRCLVCGVDPTTTVCFVSTFCAYYNPHYHGSCPRVPRVDSMAQGINHPFRGICIARVSDPLGLGRRD